MKAEDGFGMLSGFSNFAVMSVKPDFKGWIEEQLGREEAANLLEALDKPAVIGVRVNKKKPYWRVPADAEVTPWNSSGYVLKERLQFTLIPEFHGGAFYVQEPASMAVESVVGHLAGGEPVRILDLCAAPGGKSTAILSAMPAGSVLVANEVVPQRAAILRENILKWGNPNVIVTSTSASKLGRLRGVFDIILVDAPCSGEGMMRKDSDAVAQWSEGLVNQCAALQRDILDDIIPALRDGGSLIFGTCTFNKVENEGNVERLEREYGFERVEIDDIPVRFMPHVTCSEGLFLQALRSPGDGVARKLPSVKPAKVKVKVPEWIEHQSDYSVVNVYSADGSVFMLGKDFLPLYGALVKEKIKVLHAGVEIGVVKGKDFIPSASLALSTALREDAFPRVEVSERDALEYLRRNPIVLAPGSERGYVLVCRDGMPLGFVKNLGNRTNNLWPAAWRIRTK